MKKLSLFLVCVAFTLTSGLKGGDDHKSEEANNEEDQQIEIEINRPIALLSTSDGYLMLSSAQAAEISALLKSNNPTANNATTNSSASTSSMSSSSASSAACALASSSAASSSDTNLKKSQLAGFFNRPKGAKEK